MIAHPGGRPTIYSQDLAEKICEIIASHANGLHELHDLYNDFPTPRTIQIWNYRHPEFFRMFQKAKSCQSHILMDKCLTIANRDEKPDEQDSLTKISRDRVKIAAYSQQAGRLNNSHYGDKKEVTHNGTIEHTESSIRNADSQYQY